MSPLWDPGLRRGRTVVYTLHAHLACTPKYRRGPFTDEILVRCEEVVPSRPSSRARRDPAHLLVHYPPKAALSRLAGSLKGVSARRLRQEFASPIRKYLWGDHFRSPSYFAASAGGTPLKVIKEYIENQKHPG